MPEYLLQGIEYLGDVDDFRVRHNAPRRHFGDLRKEFNNDAASLYENHGKVYIAFSTGIDSQIIARCFSDQGIPAEYIFVHSPGYNDIELSRIKECENLHNIKVTIIPIDIEDFKDEWMDRASKELAPSMHQYQFEWLSSVLHEDYPIISQGSNEPYIVGDSSSNVSIYRNKFEDMRQRFSYMEKHRLVYDFPYSPESIASYYTDRAVQGYCASLLSYRQNALEKNGSLISHGQMWNYYPKPMVKAQYFLKDVIWYGKITGFEEYPSWFINQNFIKETRISVPYWDLVEFLSNNQCTYKEYTGWHFPENKRLVPHSIRGPE